MGVEPIARWDGDDRRALQLFYSPSFAAGQVDTPTLPIVCRRFQPQSDDLLTKDYPTSRQKVVLNLPPFVLAEPAADSGVMDAFVETHFEYFIKELKVGSIGEVLNATFDEATRLSKKVSILQPILTEALH